MKNFADTNKTYHLLGWTLFGLLISLLALEGWRYSVKPSELSTDMMVENKLKSAANYFLDQQQQLVDRTTSLATTLQSALFKKLSNRYLYNTLNQFPDFWSISLYKNDQPMVWKGFAPQNTSINDRQNREEPTISLKKDNNTTYWSCNMAFNLKDSTGTVSYNLYTRYRIEQSNPLSIGSGSEFNIFETMEQSNAYPLHFSIFSPPPDQPMKMHTLSNLTNDPVGIVYITTDEFKQALAKWVENTRFWRSVYALICFILLVSIMFTAADRLTLFAGLAIQLFLLFAGWITLIYTELPSFWIQAFFEPSADPWIKTMENLNVILIHSVFALLVAVTAARKLNLINREISSNWLIPIVGMAAAVGIINMLVIPTSLDTIYQAANATDIPLLELSVIPAWATIILYLAVGMGILAVGITLVTLNRLLLRIEGHFKLSISILSASFLISIFFAQLFIPNEYILNWVFYSSLSSFVLILAISGIYFKYNAWIKRQSALRKILMASLIIAIAGIPVIYQASLRNIDEKLWKTAQDYAQKKDPLAEELTEQLLRKLEMAFRDISSEDITNNKSILQTRFAQTVQQFLSPKNNSYSFDLQLIDPSGEGIANYSTDLNYPDWVQVFDITSLQAATDIEGINKSTIRPIVQLPDLVNQQDYRTFYRGWIPIFGISEGKPIAWILCSIYRERPQFNKPIRAVMASLSYKDWNNSYLMQRFVRGQLISSTRQGFTGSIPKYKMLPQKQLKALKDDSLIYFTGHAKQIPYRTLLWNESANNTIQVSTVRPDYHLILFTFFRFSFTLLLTGFLLVAITQLLRWQTIKLLGDNKRFQDRILDSFLLATLIFLTLLIAISHYTIKKQNQDIIQQELFSKLEDLSKMVESNSSVKKNTDTGNFFSLDSLTTPLNVDASFYTGRNLKETTTPQIYQQHLLTSVLPYNIYDQLFVQNQQNAYSTVDLAGQSLLIGYRSVLNNQNQPVAAIAIPTFLESPKYDQALLETISYLILFYLLIFGFFIIGAALISKQLTRPLLHIRQGLMKISGGNLNTKIPVTHQDEIGNLALAYNNMVNRLKKLQKELAAAEREAAWKEMAQQVAHEIKNPLTPMKLNVQHLERQIKSGEQEPEILKSRIQKITADLIEQIESLSNIAADFSKFSQPISEDFTKVDLHAVLHSVIQLYQYDDKLSIQFNECQQPVYVNGIDEELKRVLINMVKNAYEAMPESGIITLGLYSKQDHAFIEIEDNGKGIAEDDRSNIFVPNFSTKSSGTGLGLAICKKIIEAHEGSISFASIEETGTTFVIKLPLYAK